MVSLRRFLFSVLELVVLIVAVVRPVVAQVDVLQSTGAAQTSVPIQVPGFRGLEPGLALVYHSGGGNGIAGVGWSLRGIPAIERQGVEGGSPQYDGSDSFRLAGQDLHSCGASSSPGCLAGGTHFAEHESYQRITYDEGLDQWLVSGRDGTESLYTPLVTFPGGTFRWKLSTVTDVLGNAVTYNWWCDTGKDCFPDNVTYNGYRVKLYYESTRPDTITYATGVSLAEVRQRLRSIKVELTSGVAIRAYKLTYVTSNSTGRSLLSLIGTYGKNVQIDPSGDISGDPSLPAQSHTYVTDPSDHSLTGDSIWSSGCTSTFGTGDFNGDGRQDVYCHQADTTLDISVGLSTGTGFNVSSWGQGCGGSGFALWTGDFNGDGKTDFFCKHDVGTAAVGLSSGSGVSWSEWTDIWCRVTDGVVTAGDFDGDGKTDVACHTTASVTPSIEVRLSTGSAFATGVTWIANWCRIGGTSWGEEWGFAPKVVEPGDFDGDGNTDLLCRGGGYRVARSNGANGFVHEGNWLGWGGDEDQHGFGDFNGDGKTDYYLYDNVGFGQTYTTQVALSDGSKFQDKGVWRSPFTCQRLSVGDMNGDGRTDIWCHTPVNWKSFVGLSNGSTSFSDWAMWKDTWCGENTVVAGDFNGDGKTDVSCHSTGAGGHTTVALSGSLLGKTDIVSTLQNSLGGTTSITYTPGTQWPNTQVPPPGQLSSQFGSTNSYSTTASTHPLNPGGPTVASVTISDGRGWSKLTSYQYSGGLYDEDERKWLGFGYAKTILPKLATETLNPYAETWFSQHVASAGAVTKNERRDGAGKIFHKTENTIAISGNGTTEPYRAMVSLRWSYVFDGTVTGCDWPCTNGERRYEEYDYDNYGNRIQTRSWGNNEVPGDETTSVSEFYPNSSTYVTNRTARQAAYLGIGIAGTKLSEIRFFYDGAAQYTSPPWDGLLTKSSVWRNTDGQYVPQCNLTSCVQYDPYGNVTQTTDIKGGQTTVAYDTLYHLFPTSVTNALGHITNSTWDELCQAVATTTNPNNQTTTTVSDALCRHDRTDGPLGTFVDTSYVSIGAPNSQYVQVDTPSPTGSGTHWKRTYFDGVQRTYLLESRGATAGQDIKSGPVSFNERGGVISSVAPRYVGEPAQVTIYEYDPFDRLKKTTLPDLNTIQQSYGLRNTYVTNPEGHITGEARNETGLVRYTIEYLGATPIITSITTNLANRTETTQDYQGNTWVSQLNSLGQVTSATDPDSGTETREYNNAGEITAFVNALSQRTELTYDLLGRILTKTIGAGTPSPGITSFTYDQVRASYFNKGFLTRMVDGAGFREDDYDALGRSAKTKRRLDFVDYVFQFYYNTTGLPSTTMYPDGQSINWTYDAAGNLATETGTITASTYDAAGRLKTRNFTGGVVTTYNYSATRGWVESINTVKNPLPAHQNLVYTYYPDGMIQTVTSPKSMESWSYAYDDLNRLLTATNVDTPSLTQSFTYNEIGNITYNSHIGTYTYPTPGTARPHAVSTAGPRSYQYNAIGQMTSRNGTVIQWNGDGKPASIGNVGFTYDGLGVRLKKVSSGQTTRYIGGDYEIAPNGTVTKNLHGGKQVGWAFFLHHRDHLGSIQAVTDPSGNEVRRQKHKPYGDQHFVSGTHLESKGWIGEREEETELLYLNARYFDPDIGRFTAPDPIVRFGQGLNRYSYAWNNPINLADPLGLDPPDGVVPEGAIRCNCRFGTQAIPSAPSSITPITLPRYPFQVTLVTSIIFGIGEVEEELARGMEARQYALQATTVDCTQPGANCVDGPQTATLGPDSPGNNSQQPDNLLYNCQNGEKTNCPGNRQGGLTEVLDKVQVGLDTASVAADLTGVGASVSWIPDLINAGISFGRGDVSGGVVSLGAMIPIVGGIGNAYRLGRAGEAAAGIVRNTQRIPSASGTAAYRVPDALNHSLRTIGEVKNVGSLSYTNQLRDFTVYANQNGYTFGLWVRPTTQLSGPLQQQVANGGIILRVLQ